MSFLTQTLPPQFTVLLLLSITVPPCLLQLTLIHLFLSLLHILLPCRDYIFAVSLFCFIFSCCIFFLFSLFSLFHNFHHFPLLLSFCLYPSVFSLVFTPLSRCTTQVSTFFPNFHISLLPSPLYLNFQG